VFPSSKETLLQMHQLQVITGILVLLLLPLLLQGVALAGSMTLSGVQGTPLAPLIIQRDPAADASAPPSVLEVVFMTNCSYVFFKGITFQPKTTAAANAIRIANRSVYMRLLLL
jgi:hypothetical protein